MGLMQAPHKHFSFCSQCCGSTGPCASYFDCKTHLSNETSRELQKKKKEIFLLTSPEGYVAHLQLHSRTTGRERKQAAQGSAFIGVEDEVPRVLQVHLCWEFKT